MLYSKLWDATARPVVCQLRRSKQTMKLFVLQLAGYHHAVVQQCSLLNHATDLRLAKEWKGIERSLDTLFKVLFAAISAGGPAGTTPATFARSAVLPAFVQTSGLPQFRGIGHVS